MVCSENKKHLELCRDSGQQRGRVGNLGSQTLDFNLHLRNGGKDEAFRQGS